MPASKYYDYTGLWLTVLHFVHKNATRGGCTGSVSKCPTSKQHCHVS